MTSHNISEFSYFQPTLEVEEFFFGEKQVSVHEVFYLRFKFKCLFLFRSFLHGVAHHLTSIDRISSVTTSYWIKNLHLSFDI